MGWKWKEFEIEEAEKAYREAEDSDDEEERERLAKKLRSIYDAARISSNERIHGI